MILSPTDRSGTSTSTLRFFDGRDGSFSPDFSDFAFPFDFPFSFGIHPGWKLQPFCSLVHLVQETDPGRW